MMMMMKYKFALEMAAVKGHFECFRFLVENRLFKAVGDTQKYQEFIDASRRRDFDLIQQLLVENVNKDILNGWKGNNLMSLFVMYRYPPSCLQVLIDRGVDVNNVDYNGFTPLMCAVLTENVNCVRFLLGLGVDVNTATVNDTSHFFDNGRTTPMAERWCRGTTALMYSACLSNNESLREMLQYYSDNEINIGYGNGRNWTALDCAVYFGIRDSVSLLIKAGAYVGYVSSIDGFESEQKHYFAMSHRRPDILELTLKADHNPFVMIYDNTDICVSDIHCLDVWVKCIKNGKIDWISYLNVLLMGAAESNQLECVSYLLDQGADINFRRYRGMTTLMSICASDHYEKIFDLLIEKGADIHIEDNAGNTSVMQAARSKTAKYLQKLKSLGANIHVTNSHGQTALMFACYEYSGSDEVIDFFMKQGLDINTQDEAGMTAVMLAARQNNDKYFKVLLDEGADLELSDKSGNTVFRFAMSRNANCLDLLLQSGKVLCDGLLKPEHKHAMCLRTQNERLSVRCLMSTMKFGLFEWNWHCSSQPFNSIAFAAVLFGISPGKINYGDAEISLFHLAFEKSDFYSIMYLLANRYLLPEDLRMLYTDNCISRQDSISSLVKKFSAEPLSLQSLSFLTISKAVSLAGSSLERSRLVDALPLPEKLKKGLRFQTNVSRLCPCYWHRIEMDSAFDNFNFREEILLDDCDVCPCNICQGLGFLLKLNLEETYSDEDSYTSDTPYVRCLSL